MPELTHAQMRPAVVPVKRPARTTILRMVGLAVIAALVLTGGATTASAAPAPNPPASAPQAAAKEVQRGYWLDAGPRLRAKYGHSKRFFGPIRNGGILGDCVDYGKANPDGDWSTGAFGHVRGGDLRQQIQFIESKWWDTGLRSATYAAARNSAVNRLKDRDFRYDWAHAYIRRFQTIDPAVVPLSDRMMAEAKLYAGTVKVTSAFTTTPQKKGDPGTVKVTVTANGHAYPGQAITWTAAGARMTTAAKTTGKDGTATINLVQTSAAPVNVTASVVSPDWSKARFSTPTSAGKQHLVRGVGPVTTKTTVSHYTATVTQDCGSECKGKPPVTFTAKAGANPVQWQALVNGKTVATLNLKAKSAGKKTFTGTDGTTVTLRYRVKVDGKWSRWVTSQTFDVVCPAWPGIQPVMVCECDGVVTGGYEFTGPGGPRFYVVRVTRGSDVTEKSIAAAETVTLAGPIASGDHVYAEWDAYADAAHTKRVGGGKWRGYTSD